MSALRLGLAGIVGVAQLACSAVLAQATAAAELSFRQDDLVDGALLLRVAVVTLLAIGLAVGAAWGLKRTLYRGALASPGQSIELAAYKRLTPRLSVYVLRIGAKQIAIVEGAGGLLHVPIEGGAPGNGADR